MVVGMKKFIDIIVLMSCGNNCASVICVIVVYVAHFNTWLMSCLMDFETMTIYYINETVDDFDKMSRCVPQACSRHAVVSVYDHHSQFEHVLCGRHRVTP